MVSLIHGFDIKTKQSKQLEREVDEFLKKGGVISGAEKRKIDNISTIKKSTTRNTEYFKASKQRKNTQTPVLEEYSTWGGVNKWKKLSEKVGGKVAASHLSNIRSGKTSIKDLEVWREVVAAIEELRND